MKDAIEVVRRSSEELNQFAVANLLGMLSIKAPGERFAIGLSGGDSVKPFLRSLLAAASVDSRTGIFENVHFFQLDEFKPTEKRLESNYDVLFQSFFGKAVERRLLQERNVHRLNMDAPQEHFAELEEFGGSFDLCVLSAGGGYLSDGSRDLGHCAGIFPDDTEIWGFDPGYYYRTGAPSSLRDRVTASPELLMRSRTGFGFILGEECASTLDGYLRQEMDRIRCPIKLLKEIPRPFLLTDIPR